MGQQGRDVGRGASGGLLQGGRGGRAPGRGGHGRAGHVGLALSPPRGSSTVKCGATLSPCSSASTCRTQSPLCGSAAPAPGFQHGGQGVGELLGWRVGSRASLRHGTAAARRRHGEQRRWRPGLPRNGRGQVAAAGEQPRNGSAGNRNARRDEGVERAGGGQHRHFIRTMAEIWWPIGPPPASVRRRWLKKRVGVGQRVLRRADRSRARRRRQPAAQ